MKYPSSAKYLLLILLSICFGGLFSALQPGTWWLGFVSFTMILFIGFVLLDRLIQWSNGGKIIFWVSMLAISLRLGVGLTLYEVLPVDGYDDPDDRAGFVYTDAHRRDAQAWELANSDRPILEAFSRKYHSDQYGGLLAFCSFAYRYFSPDAHRPLLPILLSAIVATLGVPFLWRSLYEMSGDSMANAAVWIFALYPETVLLGGAVMREPYLITLSAIALWGFICLQHIQDRSGWYWLGMSFIGMMLISPVAALMTSLVLGVWFYMKSSRKTLNLWAVGGISLVMVIGVLILAAAVNRQGRFDTSSPFGVIGGFLREAVSWDAYQLERGSGWVQKLFEEMPESLRLPFVAIYGIFQPVLPAALIEPTTATWKIIAIARAAGWYILLPLLALSFLAAFSNPPGEERRIWLWLAIMSWLWILLAAIRGGGDQWDNPRYRAIFFVWQTLLAANVFTWWRQHRSRWVIRIICMEAMFLLIFGQWYLSRYAHFGRQLDFGLMVILILIIWGVIILGGWMWDRRRLTGKGASL